MSDNVDRLLQNRKDFLVKFYEEDRDKMREVEEIAVAQKAIQAYREKVKVKNIEPINLQRSLAELVAALKIAADNVKRKQEN